MAFFYLILSQSLRDICKLRRKYTLRKSARLGENCAEVCNPQATTVFRAVMVDTWWYWVSKEWYWLIYDGTATLQGGSS